MTGHSYCHDCYHKSNPQGGWCYMFKEEPHTACQKHTLMPAQQPNPYAHLLTPKVLWGLYIDDAQPTSNRPGKDTP